MTPTIRKLHRRFNSASDPTPPLAPHLIGNNIVPNDDEYELIARFVGDLEVALQIFEAEVQLDPSNSKARKQRDRFQTTLRLNRLIISPVRRMPTELLQLVFLNLLPVDKPLPALEWRDLPWNVTQVCQRWRNAALSYGVLWREIPAIDVTRTSRRFDKKSYAAFVDDILSRSAGLPFAFSFLAPSEKYTSHPVIDVLVKYAEQWGTVSLTTTSNTISQFGGVKGRLTNLRSLTLHMQSASDPILIDVFADAPKLLRVYIMKYALDKLILPWSQLEFIKEISRQGTTVQLDKTDNVPLVANLEELQISRFHGSDPIFPPITLPHLKSLLLRLGHTYVPHDTIHNLTLPALEEVVVFRFPGNVYPYLTHLATHCPGPSKLTTLSIRSIVFDEGDLTALLQHTPALERLEVGLPPVVDLQNLLPDESKLVLVPNLRMLIVGDLMDIGHYKEIFLDIARKRCERGISDFPEGLPLRWRPGQFRTLESFRLKFGRILLNVGACFDGQTTLNGWDTGLYQNKWSEELRGFAKTLWKNISALPSPITSWKTMIGMEVNPIRGKRVHDVFTELENYRIRDAHDLYVGVYLNG